MNIEEIKTEFGYTVDDVLWLMDRVEELEKELKKENIIKLNRESFKEMMGRTFFFYQSEKIEDYRNEIPDMIVYYLSVPDTAPEFLTLEKLEAYFKEAEKWLEKVESTIKKLE